MGSLVAIPLSLLLTVAAQSSRPAPTVERSLDRLPQRLELKEPSPQHHRFTCDYLQVTPTGDLIRKQRVSAQYERALTGGKVRIIWAT